MSRTGRGVGETFHRIIRRRRRVILVVFLIGTGIAFTHTYSHPSLYEASATLKIGPHGGEGKMLAEVVESHSLSEKVALGTGAIQEGMGPGEKEAKIEEVDRALQAERVGSTQLLKIVARHPDPQSAVKIANHAAEALLRWDLTEKHQRILKVEAYLGKETAAAERGLRRSEEALKRFREERVESLPDESLGTQLAMLKGELSSLLVRATEKHPEVIRLKERIAELERQRQKSHSGEAEYARFLREVKLNEERYTHLLQKREEIRFEKVEKISEATLVEKAVRPQRPVGIPREAKPLAGAFSALLGGLFVALILDFFSRPFPTLKEIESLLSLPVLAVLPPHPFFPQPQGPVAERYRALKARLPLSEGATGKVLLVTSALPREGKTMLVIHLALAAAQEGQKTLVVEWDFKNPSLHKMFRVNREPGLSEAIRGKTSWQEGVEGLPDMLVGGMGLEEVSKIPGLDRFFVLPAGRNVPDPSVLFGSKEAEALLRELKNHFDVILLDAPPACSVRDRIPSVSKVDGVVLVYEADQTSWRTLLRAKRELVQAGAPLLGMVLYSEDQKERERPSLGTLHRQPLSMHPSRR